jgi:DNA polymerase elongation subunit (family B)
MSGPKVLFIDIETAPILMTSWSMRPPYAGAVYVIRDTYILMASYKWAHEKTVKAVSLPDFPRFKRNRHDDKDLCGALRKLLDAADIVIAHNGDSFDLKKISSRLITHDFKPPSPFKTIDTLKVSRGAFKFDSNKLDHIGRYLNEGRKIPNTGAELWRSVVEDGDPKGWATMKRYCKQDTALLARVYERIKPWAKNHPNMGLYRAVRDRPPGIPCPTCESSNTQRRGIAVKLSTRRHRFQCQDCGAWFSGKPL